MFKRRGTDGRTLSGVPPDQPDPTTLDRWVEEAKRQAITTPDNAPVTVTRSGRRSQPPDRYSPSEVDQRQREIQEQARAHRKTNTATATHIPFDFGASAPRGSPLNPLSPRSQRPPSRGKRSTPRSERPEAAANAPDSADTPGADQPQQSDAAQGNDPFDNPQPGTSGRNFLDDFD